MSDVVSGTRDDANGTPGGRVLSAVALILAAALQLVVGFFTTTAIGLISVPLWAIVLLAGLWLVAVVVLVRVARRRPVATPLVPLANALLLWAVVTAGDVWLGWTA